MYNGLVWSELFESIFESQTQLNVCLVVKADMVLYSLSDNHDE